MNMQEDLVRTNNIKPYFFGDTDEIKCSYFTQKLPKSHTWVYWIVFEGNLENNPHFRFLKWRINEMADQFYTSLIVDIREVKFGSEAIKQFKEIFGNKWFYFSSLIFITQVDDEELLEKFIPKTNLTTTDIEAFSKMIWELRKLRFEGGKTLVLPWKGKLPEMVEIKFNLDDLSEIKCECFEIEHENKKIGLISFDGIYKYGSVGKDDAFFITHKLQQFYESLKPFALVVDCTNLEYEWGDEFDLNLHSDNTASLENNNGNLRYRVIVPKEKREKFDYGIEKKYIADSFENALEAFNLLKI